MVTIDGQRLRKIKGFQDLNCPKCKQAIYQARGMVIEASERLKSDHFVQPRNTFNIQAVICPGRRETNKIMVQAV